MLAVAKWAKDKPYIIGLFAPQLVSAVKDMHEEFPGLKLRRFSGRQFPLPHLPSWFAMYRCHRKSINQVKAIWAAVYGKSFVNAFSNIFDECRKAGRQRKTITMKPEDIDQTIQFLQVMLSVSEKELEEEFANAPSKPALKRRMLSLIERTPLESSFYVFVAVPCWFMYRTSPTTLYRQARQGDFEALGKLLRLDQLMLHDPAIGKRIIEYRFNHSTSKYKKLITDSQNPPKGKTSRKNILLSVVGFIFALSQLTTAPLSTLDIMKLIEAYDEDTNSNFIEEFSDESESLRRALEPDRNLWRQILNPDIKK